MEIIIKILGLILWTNKEENEKQKKLTFNLDYIFRREKYTLKELDQNISLREVKLLIKFELEKIVKELTIKDLKFYYKNKELRTTDKFIDMSKKNYMEEKEKERKKAEEARKKEEEAKKKEEEANKKESNDNGNNQIEFDNNKIKELNM